MLSQIFQWWQTIPEHISPVLFSIGTFQIRYYSLMYLVTFYVTYRLVMRSVRRSNLPYTEETIQEYFIWAIFGLLLGARLGYVLFYNASYFLSHPFAVILPFDFNHGRGFVYTGISGMSYHGGLVGVAVATLAFCYRRSINFWRLADLFCAEIPLAYTFGRLGNFLNGELYGRITTMPWGMYFPGDLHGRLRHPSQLYEAFFEGIFIYFVIRRIRRTADFDGFVFSLYLICYGTVRFFIEFFRQPDAHIGFVTGSFTMGQVLCVFMVILGGAVMAVRKASRDREP
ncbi:MAG: prolipoprotein diacylglyceryl transferase [Deltaproteobacteria bacterium]|nr:prolipoprotein diacylglyceryl transferase [Deltaproteobacteria bacterium]